jgi:hypothetical protein
MASTFRGTIEFFGKLGIYDVILPFLLVYAITYAILEKTKVLGADKKSINAVVAFVSAFLVVASTKLVSIINQSIANVMLVMIIIFCILMLGSMVTQGDKIEMKPGTKAALAAVIGIVVLCIFMYAIGWLMPIIGFLSKYWNSEGVSAIILMVVVVGIIAWINSAGKAPAAPEKKKE